MNGRQVISQLEAVFVQNVPRVQQTTRNGDVNPDWTPFMNSFDTWMQQVSTPVELAEGLYAVRTGSTVTVTGTVRAGAVVETVGPVVDLRHGGVTFGRDGFIRGGTEDENVSVTYIARR